MTDGKMKLPAIWHRTQNGASHSLKGNKRRCHHLYFSICLPRLLFIRGDGCVFAQPCPFVLFLILAFFNAAGLFILLNAEFLAMLLVVVYVGAVAVLFLFVVMMLDINYSEFREGFRMSPWGCLSARYCWWNFLLLF